jgi:Fe-S oxidoreductase
VVLWPDTFNDHFHPETLIAGVEVLEHAGYRIAVPEPPLCCGRPLYDFGMLDTAKRRLRRILEVLRPDIEAGSAVVGLEPSCVSVFRDELTGLFPEDRDAARLARQTWTIGAFLTDQGKQHAFQALAGSALLHVHCHHKSVLGFGGEEELLRGVGLELRTLDSGCCGLAGSFGFERGKYQLSMAVGERVLLPAVRAADGETLIVADGFSCREQIAHGTARRALHTVEVLRMALQGAAREVA